MGTTPDRCPTATPPCWIVTPLTLLASSLKSRRRSTDVQVRPLRRTPSSSSPEMPPSSLSSPASPCASRLSLTTLPLDVSLSVTGDRPSLSVSSRLPPPRKFLEPPPRPPRRHRRRSEMKCWGNILPVGGQTSPSQPQRNPVANFFFIFSIM